MALLKNDIKLRALGFSNDEPIWVRHIFMEMRRRDSVQLDLFVHTNLGA